MQPNLRHKIDAAILENDLEALEDLLIRHERQEDARAVIYEAIDRVSANLDRPIEVGVLVLS